MESTTAEAISKVAKATGTIARITQWFSNPKRTIKQADADYYAIERAIELCEKHPGYNISYKNGKLTFSECTSEELIVRAKNRALADAIRKESNCERVLMLAANEVQQSESVSDEPLDEDWQTRFFDIVGDVSSEGMQLVWSKILAGEIKQPGKFSLRTIETIRNVSQSEAEIFQKVLPLILKSKIASTDCYFVCSETDILRKYGLSYDMMLRLSECGLFNASDLSAEFSVSNQKESGIAYNNDKMIIVWGINDKATDLSCGIYVLTRAGSELYSILEHRCNNEYVSDFARRIYEQNKNNVQKVTIHDAISDSKYSEEISQTFPS